MRLKRLLERKNYSKRPVEKDSEYGVNAGRYVGIRFTPDTIQDLKDIIHTEKVPNSTPEEELHSTVAYSKGSNIPGYEPEGDLKEPFDAEIDGFAIFPNDDKNCLVAKLKSDEMHRRHNKTREMGATYDYDEYIPHVTLSYDAGEYGEGDLKKLTDKYRGKKLRAGSEYDNPIETDWSRSLKN